MSSQPDFPIDFSQDPQKVFVNFLIWNIKGIETELYYPGSRSWVAVKLMIGLIDSLDSASKEKLKQQYEKLTTVTSVGKGDLEQIYRDIMSYLHRTYLQQFIRVKPLNPHPQHIGMKQDDGKSPTV